jgi:hypothetical protein
MMFQRLRKYSIPDARNYLSSKVKKESIKMQMITYNTASAALHAGVLSAPSTSMTKVTYAKKVAR